MPPDPATKPPVSPPPVSSEGSGGFRAKIIASFKFASIQFLSGVGLRLVSTIVLTRLLAPEIYGVFAVVLVYRYLLEMFSDLGLRSVILTKEGALEPKFLQTCWTIAVLRGVVIVIGSGLIGLAIVWAQSAGFVAADSAYAASALPLAIFALGCVSLLTGTQSVNRYVYERDMAFGRVTFVTILANVFGFVATVTLAYYLRSVWALVFGSFAQAGLLVLASHLLLSGPAMRPAWDRGAVRVVIGRGKWILGTSTMTALSQAADRLFLGLVMSSVSFGHYYIARQFIDMVIHLLNLAHTQMGLQVFTHILKAPSEAVRRNFYRYRLVFDAIAGFATGGFLTAAPLVVGVIFDDRYADVAPILQLLAPGLLLFAPLMLTAALGAERRFARITFLGLISATTLWSGLILAALVLGSIKITILVIALYRLPETLLVLGEGLKRGWVTPWREVLIPAGFVLSGAAAGLAALEMWEALT